MADYSQIPELAAQQAAIDRRRKIAEMIQAQSMKPLESQQVPGGYVVPTSPLLGIGKVLEAYLGKQAGKEADTAELALGQKAQGMEESAVADYIKSRQPTETPYPVDSSMSPAAQEFAQTGTQITPKTSSELDQADLMAQVSPSARMRVAGALQAKLKEQEEARKENILAKADAAKIAATAKAEKEAADRALLAAITSQKIESSESISKAKREADAEKAQTKIDADIDKKANAAKIANKSFDDLIFKIDQLVDKDGKPLPGFTSAFGQIDALYPNFMKFDKTSKAYKNLESIQAQETMRGLADAKEQVGQSFGSMQVKEWDRFTNLVRSLDPSQPDKSSLLPNLINLRNEAMKEKKALQSQIGSAPAAPAANQSSGQVRVVDW